MVGRIKSKPFFLGLGLFSLAGLLLIVGTTTYSLFFDQPQENYPGSSELNRDGIFTLVPQIYYRQKKIYLTQDYTPEVYRWYANRFGMLPYFHGQDNCIALYSESNRFLIRKVVQVTICDTINGRMIFDEHRIHIR